MINSNLSLAGLLALATYCFVVVFLAGTQSARALPPELGDLDRASADDCDNNLGDASSLQQGSDSYVDAYDLNKCGLGYQQLWQTQQSAFGCMRPSGRQIFVMPGSHWFWRRRPTERSRWHRQSHHNMIESSSLRIEGGVPVLPGEHPWYVKIMTVGTDDGKPYICGGTLIHSNLVLTAAHCLEKRTKVMVILGTIMADGSGNGIQIPADKWCYGFEGGDLGILQLREPVDYMDYKVAPACLRPQTRHDGSTLCLATGMGVINDENQFSTQLMSLVSRRRCEQYNPNPLKSCYVAEKSGSSCPGDSGSPVLCYDKCATETSRAYVVGHVQGGPPGSKCKPGGGLWHFFVTDYNKMRADIPQYISAIRGGASSGSSNIKCLSSSRF